MFDIQFSPTIPVRKVKDTMKNEDDVLPAYVKLDLDNFSTQGSLEFGNVEFVKKQHAEGDEELGEQGDGAYIGVVEIVSKESEPVTIDLDRFVNKNGFVIKGGETCWKVCKDEPTKVEVLWRPKGPGGVRQMLTFSYLNQQRRRVRFGTYLCGVAKEREMVKKVVKKKFRERQFAEKENVENAAHIGNGSKVAVCEKKKPAMKRKVNALPPRTLSFRRKQKEETQLKVSRKDLTMRRVLFDEKWMDKQETSFVAWLNFVLNPDADSDGAPAVGPSPDNVGGLQTNNSLAVLAHKQRTASASEINST